MRKKRHSAEEIVNKLRDADVELSRGLTDPTDQLTGSRLDGFRKSRVYIGLRHVRRNSVAPL